MSDEILKKFEESASNNFQTSSPEDVVAISDYPLHSFVIFLYIRNYVCGEVIGYVGSGTLRVKRTGESDTVVLPVREAIRIFNDEDTANDYISKYLY